MLTNVLTAARKLIVMYAVKMKIMKYSAKLVPMVTLRAKINFSASMTAQNLTQIVISVIL